MARVRKLLVGGLAPLAPLTPLGADRRKKKDKAPRPDYSIDLKKDRRKRKRVSIEELTHRGAEVLKERAPDLPKTDKKSMFVKVMDVLDLPRNAIANAIATAAGVDRSKMKKGAVLPKVWMSSVLEKAGMKKGAARSILGFVGDVAIDPLTYFGLGGTTGVKVARHLPRVIGPAARALKAASRSGRATGAIAKAIGTKRAAQFGRMFQRVAKAKGAKAARQLATRRLNRLLAGGAARGRKEALKLFAQHGEKGRTLFRAPFAAKGIGRIPFGAKARRYAAVAADIADKGGRVAKFAKVSQTARKAALVASAATKAEQALDESWKAAKVNAEKAKGHLAVLKARRSVFAKAEASAKAKGISIPKSVRRPVPTSELRKAEFGLREANRIVKQYERRIAAAKSVVDLGAKFEVTPGGAEALLRAAGRPPAEHVRVARRLRKEAGQAVAGVKKVTPRVRELTPAQQQFQTPVRLAEVELKAAQAGRKGTQAARKVAQAEAVDTAAAALKARDVRVALRSSPEAPGVVREATRATIGQRLLRKVPGIGPTIQRAKQALLGPGTSPMQQQMVGGVQRITRMSPVMGRQAIANFTAKVEPIVARLAAKAPAAKQKSTAEAIRRLLFNLAEAGPGGEIAAQALAGDPIKRHFKYATRQGLASDTEVKALLDEFFGAMQKAHAAKKAAGFQVGKISYALRAAFTPEGVKRVEMAKAAGSIKPGFGEAGAALQKGRWELFDMPAGPQKKLMTTAADHAEKLKAIKAAGGKKVGEAPISRAQWNRWAKRPETTPLAFGSEKAGGPSIEGGIFKESLPEAAGAQARATEEALGAAELRDLVRPWSIEKPSAVAERAGLAAHMAFVKQPSGGNPMSVLKGSGLFDRKYPVQIANMIDEATTMFDSPEAISKIMGASDRVLGVWKSFALYSPAYVIRNMVEKPIGIILAGGDPLLATKHAFSGPARMLRKALVANNPQLVAGQVFNFGGRAFRGEDIFQMARRFHAVGAGRTAIEMPARFGAGAGAGAIAAAAKGGRGIHQGVFKLNTWFEDHQKLGAWFSFLDQGLDPEDAFMRTLLAAPDMADLPQWTQKNLTRLFPWARWRLKNGSRMIGRILPQNPAFFANLQRYPNLLEGVTVQDTVPEELRPQWMRDGAFAQFMGSKEGGLAFGLQSWLPVQEAIMAAGAVVDPGEAVRQVVGEVRPELKAGIEAATGQSIFRQQSLQTVAQAGGLRRAIPKALMGQSRTALDSALALRPLREYGPGGRVAAMPTTGRKIARALIGGAVQPLDYQKSLTSKYYELRNLQANLQAQYKRADAQGETVRAAGLLKEWLAVVRQMAAYKFPLARGTEQMLEGAGVPRPGPP